MNKKLRKSDFEDYEMELAKERVWVASLHASITPHYGHYLVPEDHRVIYEPWYEIAKQKLKALEEAE